MALYPVHQWLERQPYIPCVQKLNCLYLYNLVVAGLFVPVQSRSSWAVYTCTIAQQRGYTCTISQQLGCLCLYNLVAAGLSIPVQSRSSWAVFTCTFRSSWAVFTCTISQQLGCPHLYNLVAAGLSIPIQPRSSWAVYTCTISQQQGCLYLYSVQSRSSLAVYTCTISQQLGCLYLYNLVAAGLNTPVQSRSSQAVYTCTIGIQLQNEGGGSSVGFRYRYQWCSYSLQHLVINCYVSAHRELYDSQFTQGNKRKSLPPNAGTELCWA